MNNSEQISIDERGLCPYKEGCYRKNPIHFREMSHPHLENLIKDQLDSDIIIPQKLEFICSDRDQLMDQLLVLKKVLREFRSNAGILQLRGALQSAGSKKSSTPKRALISKNNKDVHIDKALKEKIERNKLAAIQRREQKLKELDQQGAKFSEISITSKSNNNEQNSLTDRKRTFTSIDQSPAKRSRSNSTESNNSSLTDKNIPTNSIGNQYFVARDTETRKKLRDNAIIRMIQNGVSMPKFEPGNFALKFAMADPYYYFFTQVQNADNTHHQDYSVSFPELLDDSLGEIADSLHINFIIDISWLCAQYMLAAQNPNMTLISGSPLDKEPPPNVTFIQVSMPSYGCHHSKLSVLKYSDGGIRIIVSTANLYSDDWELRTQGIWMSPHLPKLPDSANHSDGESPTGFKKDFRLYLTAYRLPKLLEWESIIRRADFSSVNVFFVASIPGTHKGLAFNTWGSRKLGQVLSQHATLPPDAPQWPIIAQASSIGNLGTGLESWITPNIIQAMAQEKSRGGKCNPDFKFIYPTLSNYMNSYDCKNLTSCFPYSRKQHEKQTWLKNYLHQWKFDGTGRTKAMPHVKSYTRVSPDQTQIPWFVLTSANLSKAAWGLTAKSGLSHYIMNYEAGVVFIPELIIQKPTFSIKQTDSPEISIFRLPYDLPLTEYSPQDEPFISDFLSD